MFLSRGKHKVFPHIGGVTPTPFDFEFTTPITLSLIQDKKQAVKVLNTERDFVEAYVEFTHYVEMLYLEALDHSVHSSLEKRQAEKHYHNKNRRKR